MSRVSMIVVTAVLSSGCWASHKGPGDVAGFESEPYDVPALVPESVDPEPEVFALAGGAAPELVEPSAPEEMGAAAEAEEDELAGKTPIIFDVAPKDACINKDLWISIEGTFIHWDATVTVTYPYNDASMEVGWGMADSCGRPFLDWDDISSMSFRSSSDLTWDGMPRFVPGHYLVSITNPGGETSNAVGLNLQWCDEGEVAEPVTPCS